MNVTLSVLDSWARWAMASSWQIALLAALIAAVALATRRMSARFRYVLWSLILVKAFLPPSLATVWSVGHWGVAPLWEETQRALPDLTSEGPGEGVTLTEGELASAVPAAPSSAQPATAETTEETAVGSLGGVQGEVGASKARPTSSAGAVSAPAAVTWRTTLFSLWAAGVVAFLGVVVWRYVRLLRRLRRARVVEEGPLRVELEQIALAMGKADPPELILSDDVTSPFLIGLFRPRIVLPASLSTTLTPDHLRNILLHELTHWRRGDVWVGWLQVFAQAMFWFHPVVWLANAQIRHERESACDEEAVVRGACDPAQYGESLLKALLVARGRSATQLGFLGIFERGTKIQRRLEDIMYRENRRSRFGWGNWVFLALFALVFLPMSVVTGRSADMASLAARIQQASPGDTVNIPAGTYTESIDITQPITLMGDPDGGSVIEFQANAPAIRIHGVEGVKLFNLAVRWSPQTTDARFDDPAAVSIRDSTVSITNCRFEPIDQPKLTPYAVLAAGRSNVDILACRSTGFAYTFMFTEGANGSVAKCVLADAGHSVVTLHQFSNVRIEGNIMSGCEYHAVRNTGGTVDMRHNLVLDNNRAGTYLGNKSAHGVIENNVFLRNRGGIWAYASSDVTIRNNVFADSKSEGIGFHASCDLTIERNSFVSNPVALAQFSTDKFPGRAGAKAKENHYWNNQEDTRDFDKESDALSGDPLFAGPDRMDFTPGPGSPLQLADGSRIGLTDSEAIALVWGFRDNLYNPTVPGNEPAPSSSAAAAPQPAAGAVEPADTDPTSIIAFSPVPPFAPQTARELLSAFNANHPEGVRTHHFRTQVKGDHLVGFICVDGVEGEDKIKQMIAASDQLALLEVEEATPEAMAQLLLMGQPSLDGAEETYRIVFQGANGFNPADARALLDAFNEYHPSGVRTHHYQTETQKGALVGSICIDSLEGLDAVLAMFEKNPKLALIDSQPVPQEELQEMREKSVQALAESQRSGPPTIVATNPLIGARDVDPNLTEITITFDRGMAGGFSWTGGPPLFPAGREGQRPHWTEDRRTCILPVTLEQGRYYRVGINSKSHQNFRSSDGVPVRPTAIYFTTIGAGPAELLKLEKPLAVHFDPPNGATDVDPSITELKVTFSMPMGGGFSWTGGGPSYPPGREGQGPYWTRGGLMCVRPVALEPGKTYRLGLNSPSHVNFQSEGGIPLDPVVYTFTTRDQ